MTSKVSFLVLKPTCPCVQATQTVPSVDVEPSVSAVRVINGARLLGWGVAVTSELPWTSDALTPSWTGVWVSSPRMNQCPLSQFSPLSAAPGDWCFLHLQDSRPGRPDNKDICPLDERSDSSMEKKQPSEKLRREAATKCDTTDKRET